MCSGVRVLVGCVCSMLIGAVLCAPVNKENFDDIKEALKTHLKDQEHALESLASLTGSNAAEYSKTNSMSYSNVNGAENKLEQTEEKVSEPLTDNVVSDAQEEWAEERPSPDVQPLTSYMASLDIPSLGIHKQVSNDDEQQEHADDENLELEDYDKDVSSMKDTLEFTPLVVAKYLYRTGETREFQNLLSELVESSEISAEEAEQYEKAVMDQLFMLDRVQNVNMDDAYPQGYAEDASSEFPMYGSMQNAGDVYPLYGYDENAVSMPKDNMEEYVDYVLNKPVTLDDMINTVIDSWLTNAIYNGDPEAEEILSNIVDYVSRDNDPNDEEQVKAILGDIFAEAIVEDLTPRIEPQELTLGQDQLPLTQQIDEDETQSSETRLESQPSETQLEEQLSETKVDDSEEQQSEHTDNMESETTETGAASEDMKM